MKSFLLTVFFCASMPAAYGAAQIAVSAVPATAVVYWDSPEGKVLRSRIPADADYWQLAPTFAVQMTQSYCSVASAITVLNAMPINKPIDPAYVPYAYFTQTNFFTPEVVKIISPQTVLEKGMTREQMAQVLAREGVEAVSIAGDTLSEDALRMLLRKSLGDDGRFVLANYYRAKLGQVGGGHWSALAAYDADSDRVLILDVAKYKYPPAWVTISVLRQAISTTDETSGKSRGLVIISR
jgi:hypothetical protein